MSFCNKTAAVLTAAVCLLGTILALEESLSSFRKNQQEGGNPVVKWEKHISQLAKFLPDAIDIGYLSELNYLEARDREFKFIEVDSIGRYYILQYALAPRRVFYSTAYPQVISIFSKSTPVSRQEKRIEEEGLHLVVDIGQGVALYKRQ